MTRREIVSGAAGLGLAANGLTAAASTENNDPELIRRTDASATRLMQAQVTDSRSKWYGGVPDATELYNAASAGSLATILTAAFVHPKSKHYKKNELIQRIELGAKFMEK